MKKFLMLILFGFVSFTINCAEFELNNRLRRDCLILIGKHQVILKQNEKEYLKKLLDFLIEENEKRPCEENEKKIEELQEKLTIFKQSNDFESEYIASSKLPLERSFSTPPAVGN